MAGHQIDDLTAWLKEDDTKGRGKRARRLRDLLDILPVPSEGLFFVGGDESVACFDEVRRCYLDGSYLAVVLLCLSFVERELAGLLYEGGWNPAKSARLGSVLEKAHEAGVLSMPDWQTFRELARIRNSYAHFRPPLSSTSLMARALKQDDLPNEILAKDAMLALQAMSRIVRRNRGLLHSGG